MQDESVLKFMTANDINFFFTKYFEYYPFLIPLGIIGTWRWSIWGIKKITGLFYKPQKAGFKTTVSIVTPVYNENPQIFSAALSSWAKNKPDEIIAVIDYTDKNCIEVFEKFAKKNKNAKFVVTKTPGKREALADGIKAAKSEIVALVDSDTLWMDETLSCGIAPFKDKKVAGVATRQSIKNPSTLSQKLFSMRLEQRYWDDYPFLARSGHQIVCLSGRTSFYRRSALLPMLPHMLNEKFMGYKVISGEDKRLTYLLEALGWKTAYQSTSKVATFGEKKITTLLKQQVRWTRNSWRNDLRALYQKWPFRHPVFAFYLIDRAVQPFTLIISPVYFLISLFFGLWVPVATIIVWWLISRTIKIYPHLKKYPLDILILPVYVIFNFITAYIRIYSLISINTHSWVTRWHRSRLSKFTPWQLIGYHAATLSLFAAVAGLVYFYKWQTFFIPYESQKELIAKTLPKVNILLAAAKENTNVLGESTMADDSLLTKRYEFQPNDSLSSIAQKYGVTLENLLMANVAKITNWQKIDPKISLTIPPSGINLAAQTKFNYKRIYPDVLSIYYDTSSNQIVISGRGKIITFSDIAKSVGGSHLEEVSPRVWLLKTSLYIRSGLTLKMNQNEVSWLKMESNSQKFTRILAYNSDIFIKDVKITSWDSTKDDYDKNYQDDGRAYILVKDGSRMDVVNSEVAYLGYPRTPDLPYSPYGISWRMSTGNLGKTILTGEVENSKFHHNYFGAYTFGATGMTWRGNEFYNNVRYGLDPHDDSNGFLVENNIFHDNGTHGLIFSKRCIRNVIRNNISYNNGLHGIMLHEQSDGNIIENNKIYGNTDGIALDHSSRNIIRNNTIYQNKRGLRADKASVNNLIANNTIIESDQYGIYLYGESDYNLIQNNVLANNTNGIYIKSSYNQALNNTVDKNQIGIYFLKGASNNEMSGNTITYSKFYGIYAKLPPQFSNAVEETNFIWRNKKNLAAEEIE